MELKIHWGRDVSCVSLLLWTRGWDAHTCPQKQPQLSRCEASCCLPQAWATRPPGTCFSASEFAYPTELCSKSHHPGCSLSNG